MKLIKKKDFIVFKNIVRYLTNLVGTPKILKKKIFIFLTMGVGGGNPEVILFEGGGKVWHTAVLLFKVKFIRHA